jgi:hypothetical protein
MECNAISCRATECSGEGAPCSFPLEQRARVQLVRAQLKDTSRVAGRRRWQEGELLRKLSSPGPEKRSQRIMGLLMLSGNERRLQGVPRCVTNLGTRNLHPRFV